MNEVKKNILVNAAKSCNQDVDTTMELAAEALTGLELVTTKTLMRAGIEINHTTVNKYF